MPEQLFFFNFGNCNVGDISEEATRQRNYRIVIVDYGIGNRM